VDSDADLRRSDELKIDIKNLRAKLQALNQDAIFTTF
jgi:hypothetical protein